MKINTIFEYLESTAQQYPNKTAIVDEHQSLTYSELRENALKIANALIERNLFKKPFVVLMDKSVQCIAAFFGGGYSGNFYTPIDNNMPHVLLRIKTAK